MKNLNQKPRRGSLKLLFVLILIVFAILYLAAQPLVKFEKECESGGGTVLKTTRGWACADIAVRRHEEP